MTPPAVPPSDTGPHDLPLVRFERWNLRYGDRPRIVRPSDDGLKFGQFTGVVQAGSDLISSKTGKFGDNVFSGLASGQVPEHKPYGDTCSL